MRFFLNKTISLRFEPVLGIASTSLDSTLIIWDLLSGQKVHEMSNENVESPMDVWKVVFSPDGSQVAAGSHTGKVIIYGIKNATVDRVLDTRGKFVLSVAWVSFK